MSLFYLLPPRPIVGDRLVCFLQSLLPGLDWNVQERRELADLLGEAAGRREDVFLVHREDLPGGEGVARALADGFGAEEGDEVIEVRVGLAGELTSRRWRMEASLMQPGERGKLAPRSDPQAPAHSTGGLTPPARLAAPS